ncbi:hypothetical protein E9993_15600 [Labilibacter sediminis]|nr:hypothetical protein E9993_15600 [Labilibacter sediminis]
MLRDLDPYSKKIFDLPNVSLTLCKPNSRHQLVLTTDSSVQKGVFLDPDYFSYNKTSTVYSVPIGMHPLMYINRYYQNISLENIKEVRNIPILFAGNASEEHYDNPVLMNHFNVISRSKVINFLKSSNSIKTFYPQNLNDFHNTYKPQSVLINEINTFKIPIDHFLDILTRTNFFLALPGVTMPLSHNVIEAMACGCIPILQFNHLMSPPLEHNKNCIKFNLLSELQTIIEDIESLSPDEIMRMRNNVINYYQKHLTTQAIASDIINHCKSDNSILLNAEYHSVDLLVNQPKTYN